MALERSWYQWWSSRLSSTTLAPEVLERTDPSRDAWRASGGLGTIDWETLPTSSSMVLCVVCEVCEVCERLCCVERESDGESERESDGESEGELDSSRSSGSLFPPVVGCFSWDLFV